MNNIKTKVNYLKPYFNIKNIKTNKDIKICVHSSIIVKFLIKNTSKIMYNIGYHTVFIKKPVKKARIFFGSYDFDLKEEQVYFLLGHELAHVEFLQERVSVKEGLLMDREKNTYSKLTLKSIMNETMCDIKSAQITQIDDNLIDSYFENIEKCCGTINIYTGYLPYKDRAKYSKEFKKYNNSDNKIPKDKFLNYLEISFKEAGEILNKEDKATILSIIDNSYYNYFC